MGIALYVLVLSLHMYFVRHEVKQAAAETGPTPYAALATHLRDPWNLQDLFRLTLVSEALVYYFVLCRWPYGSRWTTPHIYNERSDHSRVCARFFVLSASHMIDSAAEIRVLGQLLHDKTDDLKEENAGLRKKLDTQASDTKNIKEKLDTQAQENAELRKLLETQMQSISDFKDILIKMMAASQDK